MPETALSRILPGSRIETPLCRCAEALASLTGWRRHLAALLLGVVAAATLPPVDLTPLLFVAFPGLLWLDRGSRGFWSSFALGYSFGFGFLVAGLYWIAAALFVDIASFWWALPFAVAGLPAGYALLTGAALALTGLAARHWRLPQAARIALFAIAWTLSEWIRGHALTGFPWNLIGYAWSGGFPGASAVLQSTAWIGIYGLGYLTVLAVSLPALLGIPALQPISRTRRWAPLAAAGLLLLVPACAGAIRLAAAPRQVSDTWVRIVQPVILQSTKWDPTAAEANFRRILALSAARPAHPLAAILWPEAAVTFLLERDAGHRVAIAGVAPENGYVVTGALRANPPPAPVREVWNSIEAVDPHGDIVAHYDKAHLVPFGEYMPLRDVLPLKKITAGAIDLSPGPGAATIALPGLPAFAPFICYEAIFPGTIVDPDRRPDWLFNVTNDAWYGRSSGPYQHFAIARTRAIEEGLPLVRVANNGISGVVDRVGRVVARLDLDTVGYADVTLPPAGPVTLYARVGDWILLVLLALGAIPVALRLR
jgi:apolipoprotein N-acyltransferase